MLVSQPSSSDFNAPNHQVDRWRKRLSAAWSSLGNYRCSWMLQNSLTVSHFDTHHRLTLCVAKSWTFRSVSLCVAINIAWSSRPKTWKFLFLKLKKNPSHYRVQASLRWRQNNHSFPLNPKVSSQYVATSTFKNCLSLVFQQKRRVIIRIQDRPARNLNKTVHCRPYSLNALASTSKTKGTSKTAWISLYQRRRSRTWTSPRTNLSKCLSSGPFPSPKTIWTQILTTLRFRGCGFRQQLYFNDTPARKIGLASKCRNYLHLKGARMAGTTKLIYKIDILTAILR